MSDERIKPHEIRHFCDSLRMCFTPPLSNRGLFQKFNMDGDANELNRQTRIPKRGKLPPPTTFLDDFLLKIEAEINHAESELHYAIISQNGELQPWILFNGNQYLVNRERLVKQLTLEDYVSFGYLRIDYSKFLQLESDMINPPTLSEAKWKEILSDLKNFWKFTRGKKGACFLPYISRLIVQSVLRFNSHPPIGANSNRIASSFSDMLQNIGRQSHHKRFQESLDDMELRHNAILVRAMQFHAAKSVRKARRHYRMILDIPAPYDDNGMPIAKSNPQEAFLLNGKVPADDDHHAVHILTNVLCFEVCLGEDNFGDDRWHGLHSWIIELRRRAKILNIHSSIVHSFRIEAEWQLCKLGMRNQKNVQVKHARAAQSCLHEIRKLEPGNSGPWMEWEVLKLESIITIVLSGKSSITAKLDQMYKVALDGKLHSQASQVDVFRKLVGHIELYVQYGIQLHHARDVLKKLKSLQ